MALGLVDTDPATGYRAALAAFAAGDEAAVLAGAAATVAALAGAEEIGRGRATTAGVADRRCSSRCCSCCVATASSSARRRPGCGADRGAERRAAGRAAAAAPSPLGGQPPPPSRRPTVPRLTPADPYATLAATPDLVGATRGRRARRERSGTGLMGLSRSRPSHEILSGDSADVYFARAEAILEKEGRDPLVTMEVFAREDARPVRDRRGAQPPRPRAGRRRPGRDAARGAVRRRRHRAQGDRPPDPGALPPVRAVRDGLPRDARPVDRLGDGRPARASRPPRRTR